MIARTAVGTASSRRSSRTTKARSVKVKLDRKVLLRARRRRPQQGEGVQGQGRAGAISVCVPRRRPAPRWSRSHEHDAPIDAAGPGRRRSAGRRRRERSSSSRRSSGSRAPGSSPAASIYGIIGVLALKLALGDGGKPTNQQGALQTVAHQPFGKLPAHARRDRPRRLRALAARPRRDRARARGRRTAASTASPRSASGLAYGALCVARRRDPDRRASSRAAARRRRRPPACSAGPAGTWIVGIAGVVMIGVALYQGYQGLTQKFLDDSKTERDDRRGSRRWIGRLGTVGHLARMVVFGLVGVFLIKAAVDYDPNKAVGARRRAGQDRPPLLRPAPARHRRRRTDRLRALLAQRRPLPQDLTRSATERPPRPPSPLGSQLAYPAECWFGAQISKQICSHHRRRLRGSTGSVRSTRRPAAGLPVTRRPARQRSRGSDRRRTGAAGDRGRAAAGRVARPPDRLALLTRLRARRDREPLVLRNLLGRAGRADRRTRPRLGRGPAATLSPVARRRARDARAADDEHADPVRARREGAADALPPREDDRDRRPRRLRRRHRPDLRIRRPLRHERPPVARAQVGWHDARARSRARRSATSPSTSGCAGTRSPANTRRRSRPASRPASRGPDRPHRARAHLRRRAERRLPHPRVLPPRLQGGPRVHLPREPVPLVTRDRRRTRRQARATTRTRDFRLLLLLPAKPNTGADDTRGVARGTDRGRRRRGSPARLHALRTRGRSPIPSTSTRRSRSSTTTGSPSARRTSTSTRCSTTPK